ncbi:MAG: hypothetical protein U0892_19260 [Pirellulales bacterium]
MMQEVGHRPGVENYSRPLSGKPPGATPDTPRLLPKDFSLMVRRVGVTVPAGASHVCVRSQSQDDTRRTRLCLCSRARTIDCLLEEGREDQSAIFVSATPNDYELQKTGGEVVEQIIRPDRIARPGRREVVPQRGKSQSLAEEIQARTAAGERTLVTALTKRLAEDLAAYLTEQMSAVAALRTRRVRACGTRCMISAGHYARRREPAARRPDLPGIARSDLGCR